MNKALLSSEKMDWGTPQDFFDKLNEEFHFVGDMASSDDNAKCEFHYTESDDALTKPWNLGGYVFCNPPYGRQLGKWVKKAYEEWARGAKIVMLIPARTDTSYFHDWIYPFAKIRFVRGRLYFVGDNGENEGRAPFPSMVAIYD